MRLSLIRWKERSGGETEEVDRLVPGENVRVTGDLPVKVKKGVFGVNETFNN